MKAKKSYSTGVRPQRFGYAGIACRKLSISSCSNNIYMEQSIEQHRWVNAVVAAKGYPAEVHSGYLAANKNLLAALPKTGVINDGWHDPGTSLLSSGVGVPSELFLTWLSYAEKKFWKLEAALDAD